MKQHRSKKKQNRLKVSVRGGVCQEKRFTVYIIDTLQLFFIYPYSIRCHAVCMQAGYRPSMLTDHPIILLNLNLIYGIFKYELKDSVFNNLRVFVPLEGMSIFGRM